MHQLPGNAIGLALSGGGLRATLFGLGSLWRLNDLGWLPHLRSLTGVSGGALTVGLLASRWDQLDFSQGTARNFVPLVARPLEAFVGRGLSLSMLTAAFLDPRRTAAEVVADYYAKWLYGDVSLPMLPAPQAGQVPEFIIYASSLQTGGGIGFSQRKVRSLVLGELENLDISLATLCAASSAVPPFLSPAVIRTAPSAWTGGRTDVPNLDALRREMVLSDGGVYDNMGLRAVMRDCDVMMASDAGAPFRIQERPPTFWPTQLSRVMSITGLQGERLRRSAFLADLRLQRRRGAYWSVASHIDDYGLLSAMTDDTPTSRTLCDIPTARKMPSLEDRRRLVNWGYALADASIRRHVSHTAPAGEWPYPAFAF
jgi:NTE family protein